MAVVSLSRDEVVKFVARFGDHFTPWELRRGPSQTHLSGSAFAVSGEPQHRICGFSTVGHAGVVSHWDLPLTFGFLVHLSERETTAIAGTLLSARADHAIVT
ncbi:MAG TPA: hypothetical protein VM910_36715 [Bradyrhizobium sp.]|nr:hypothetical protein [Bradyrhizobium sp.]